MRANYSEYAENFNIVWKYLVANSKSSDELAVEICEKRKYYGGEERWKKLFKEVGIAFVNSETCDLDRLKIDRFKDMALFSDKGNFIIENRYIIPIRDMIGNIVALVGWYPDEKRYITTPSRYFSKSKLFFGLEQISKTGLNANYFLVEGIFDTLSLRSLGFNAIGQMGIEAGRYKEVLYGLFNRIVAIPDCDKRGLEVIKTNKWGIPVNASYLRWVGETDISNDEENKVKVKDIDYLIKIFEEEDVKDLLNQCMNAKSVRNIKFEL